MSSWRELYTVSFELLCNQFGSIGLNNPNIGVGNIGIGMNLYQFIETNVDLY